MKINLVVATSRTCGFICRKILGGTPASDIPSLSPKWKEATELRLLGVVRPHCLSLAISGTEVGTRKKRSDEMSQMFHIWMAISRDLLLGPCLTDIIHLACPGQAYKDCAGLVLAFFKK